MDRREPPLDTSSEARLRLLYRIPVAPAPGRALDVGVEGQSVLRGSSRAQDVTEFDVARWDAAAGLPFADASFAVVALHRTLDHVAPEARAEARRIALAALLAQVARTLSPGGLVIGCVENRLSFDRAVARLKGRPGDGTRASVSRAAPALSVHQCDRALAAAGFEDVRLFNLLPSMQAPTRLLAIERGWSRRVCVRQVEEFRGLIRPLSYAAWRMLAEIGASQYLGPATFFWGRKPC